MIRLLILFFFLSVLPFFTWGQASGSVTLDEWFEKIRVSHNESYIISSELKDTLKHYSNAFRSIAPSLKGNLTSAGKRRYYAALIMGLSGSMESKDSLFLLRKQVERESLDFKDRIALERTIATSYDHLDDPAKSFDLLFKALEQTLAKGDSALINVCTNAIGTIISYRFPTTPQWVDRKVELGAQLSENYGLSDVVWDANTPFYDFQKVLILRDLPEESIFLEGYADDLRFIRSRFESMERELAKVQESESAGRIKYERYGEMLSYFKDRSKTNNLYYNLVHSYILFLAEQGDYEKGALFSDELDKVLPADIGYDYFDYLSFYDSAASAHKAMGNFQRSLYYTEKLNRYDFVKTYIVEKAYDYLLERINGVTQAKIELQWTNDKKRRAVIIGAISIISVLGLVILYISLRNGRRLRRSRNKALQMIKEKERLEGKIEMLETVISRDLHDNFGNKISGILNSYEIIKQINKTEKLNSKLFSKFNLNLEKSLSDLLVDIKDLVWVNDPKNNSLDRLLYRLESHFANTDIQLRVLSSFESDIILPKFWNRQLFLIFKEATENALQHSEVKKVVLKVYALENTRLILEAVDSGRGFDVSGGISTRGLDNMKKRAASIGATLHIISIPKKGTSIKFVSQDFDMEGAMETSKDKSIGPFGP